MMSPRIAKTPYHIPRWDLPFDPEPEIQAAPTHAMVRGMFFDFAVDRARRISSKTVATQSRVAFVQYSMRDYMRLLADCAAISFPHESLRSGLRRLGTHLYDDFSDTMIGRAIFSVSGRRFDKLVAMAPRAYSTSYDPCELKTSVIAPDLALVRFEPMHVFMDTFHYGAWEGAARYCHVTPTIRVHLERPGIGEFEIGFR